MTWLRMVAATTGVVILMSIGGCSEGAKVVEIDGHIFRVPTQNLVQGTIPWLTASQSDGLTFIVNPEASMEQQLSVRIESTLTRCSRENVLASNQLASACSVAFEDDINKGESKTFVLEKMHQDDDPTQWEYRLKNQGTVVASCYVLSEGRSGLCTSLGNYKNLVYSLGLRDGDIERLPSIRDKINNLLLSWEVQDSNL